MIALLWVAWAGAQEPERVPVPEVGTVYETTAAGVLSVGYGTESTMTPPDGPTYYERGWVETFPAQWLPRMSNPHGGYVHLPVGALVECVAVRVGAAPSEIATVTWYTLAPAEVPGMLFYESYVVVRGPSTAALLDGAVPTKHPPAFDTKAWKRVAGTHPDVDLSQWVAKPPR